MSDDLQDALAKIEKLAVELRHHTTEFHQEFRGFWHDQKKHNAHIEAKVNELNTRLTRMTRQLEG